MGSCNGMQQSNSFVSMASTIDQNSSRLMKRPAYQPMGSAASSIPEGGQQEFKSMIDYGQPSGQPSALMSTLLGMVGGSSSTAASAMGSQNGSLVSAASMVENTSPNRTPMSSANGKPQPAPAVDF